MTVTHPVFGTQIPSGWTSLRVDDIRSPEPSSCVAGPFGSNISSKYFVDEGVPVIRGGNLTDDLTPFVPNGFVFVSEERAQSYKAQHVRAGDLVFTCWGTIGQVGRIPEGGPYSEYIISNKQLKLRPDPARTDSRFLYYYFASPQMVEHIKGRAIGSAVPGINLGILKALPVVLPPLPTQHKIAAILSAYDDLIENNSRRIKLLEEMAKRIYREWFIDFRYPGYQDVPLVSSRLGPIPQGWAVAPLRESVELLYGKALRADDRHGGAFPVFGSGGQVGFHDQAMVEAPGIIVGRKGNVGSIMWSDSPFFPIDTTFFVRTKLPMTYVFFGLGELDFIDSHAAVPGLSRDQAYALQWLTPDVITLASFDRVVSTAFAMKSQLGKSCTYLRESRDLVLPGLISGDIDVDDLNIELPDPA